MNRAWRPLLVSLLLLGGCAPASSSADAATTPDPPPGGGAVLLASLAAATPEGGMPLAALADTTLPDQATHDAIEAAIASCMEQKGFAYQPVPFSPLELFGDRRYGITDEAVAAEYGYQPPADPDRGPEQESAARPPVDGTALFGDGATAPVDDWRGGNSTIRVGGCLQEGWDAVVGDYVAWTAFLDRLQWIIAEASTAAQSDPRVQAALEGWVDCMAEAGYTVTSLEDAPYDGGPTAAVADARCHAETNLASIWASVEAEQQWALLPEHADALADLLDETTLLASP